RPSYGAAGRSPALDAEQQIHGGLVSGRKPILLELARRDPAAIGDAARARVDLADDRRLVQREVDRVAVVVVRATSDVGAHLDLDAHALGHLTLQRLRVGLAFLDLAAGKLPQPGEHSRRAALCDEVPIAARDHGRNDTQMRGLGHDGPPYCGITCTMVKRVTPIETHALRKEGWVYMDVRSSPEF